MYHQVLFGLVQFIVPDTIFYVPQSSSCICQVFDYHSSLVTTSSSSIGLTSQSVSHLSLSLLCIIHLILDKLKIAKTKDPLHHGGKNGSISMGRICIMLLRMGSTPVWRFSIEIISTHTTSTSLVVPIKVYKRLNIFAILSIASFQLDLNIKPPRYIKSSQRSTSSQTNTWTILMRSATM